MSKQIGSVISLDNILTSYFLEVYDIQVETHFPIPEKFFSGFLQKMTDHYELVTKVNVTRETKAVEPLAT